MYIARDKNGALYVYTKVPVKRKDLGVWMADSRCNRSALLPINITLPKSINPQWSDLKPIEVKLVRKNK
jgi:hypothetical protein